VTNHPTSAVTLTGLVRIRQHCLFRWQEPEGGGERTVDILPTHCAECVKEIQQRGYKSVRDVGERPREEDS
jgi:hypothetical protein